MSKLVMKIMTKIRASNVAFMHSLELGIDHLKEMSFRVARWWFRIWGPG